MAYRRGLGAVTGSVDREVRARTDMTGAAFGDLADSLRELYGELSETRARLEASERHGRMLLAESDRLRAENKRLREEIDWRDTKAAERTGGEGI